MRGRQRRARARLVACPVCLELLDGAGAFADGEGDGAGGVDGAAPAQAHEQVGLGGPGRIGRQHDGRVRDVGLDAVEDRRQAFTEQLPHTLHDRTVRELRHRDDAHASRPDAVALGGHELEAARPESDHLHGEVPERTRNGVGAWALLLVSRQRAHDGLPLRTTRCSSVISSMA